LETTLSELGLKVQHHRHHDSGAEKRDRAADPARLQKGKSFCKNTAGLGAARMKKSPAVKDIQITRRWDVENAGAVMKASRRIHKLCRGPCARHRVRQSAKSSVSSMAKRGWLAGMQGISRAGRGGG